MQKQLLASRRKYQAILCALLLTGLVLCVQANAFAQTGPVSYSKNPEADRAMKEGEAAFAAEDYDKALEAYQRALKLDSRLYEAPLVIGDVYFQKKQMDKAGEWYARAIAIDANRETAYRYWSDAYLRVGKMKESLDKAADAIVAEPYNKMSYRGIIQWAQANKVQIGHPEIEIPTSISSDKPGEVNINIDPKILEGKDDDGSSAWLVYSITRASWRTDKYAKTYPKGGAYRHSLAEEADALRMVITSVKADKKVKKPTPSLANLIKLEQAGLLEAYILLGRADEGIAQDYEAYRNNNKDKLKRYIIEIVAKGWTN
jgi:tetratricopeptide (TPR) repeat protein